MMLKQSKSSRARNNSPKNDKSSIRVYDARGASASGKFAVSLAKRDIKSNSWAKKFAPVLRKLASE